jgi:hypothetical protein
VAIGRTGAFGGTKPPTARDAAFTEVRLASPKISTEERMKRGLCSKCAEKPLASKYFCKDCLAARRQRAKELRAKRGI